MHLETDWGEKHDSVRKRGYKAIGRDIADGDTAEVKKQGG